MLDAVPGLPPAGGLCPFGCALQRASGGLKGPKAGNLETGDKSEPSPFFWGVPVLGRVLKEHQRETTILGAPQKHTYTHLEDVA